MRTDRQGMEWQLVEEKECDGWWAGATNGSPLDDIAGTGFCETTITECPAACQTKFNTLINKVQIFCNILITFVV